MKQIPRGVSVKRPSGYLCDDYGGPTNTDYLNKHAKEWEPPLGDLHLHLIFARTVHWRVVDRGSSVCSISGRCYKVRIRERD